LSHRENPKELRVSKSIIKANLANYFSLVKEGMAEYNLIQSSFSIARFRNLSIAESLAEASYRIGLTSTGGLNG